MRLKLSYFIKIWQVYKIIKQIWTVNWRVIGNKIDQRRENWIVEIFTIGKGNGQTDRARVCGRVD